MDRRDVRPGMVVRSADGERLGTVTRVGDASFHVEKGFFFRHDYEVSYRAVRGQRDDGQLVLAHGREALRADTIRYHGAPRIEEPELRTEEEVEVTAEHPPSVVPLQNHEIGYADVEQRMAAPDSAELEGFGEPQEYPEGGNQEPSPIDPRRGVVADGEEERLRSPFAEEFDPLIRR